MKPRTRLIHPPGGTCPVTGAVSPPIHPATTFRQDAVDKNRGYDYSRTKNPTRDVLEAAIADLEGGRAGFAFASGTAAITACLAILKVGDHVVATEGLYGGTYRVLTGVFAKFGISATFADTTDLKRLAAAFRPETRMLFLETPSNPLLRVTDLAAAAKLAHDRNVLVAVDNTLMSPWLQKPLAHGADIVVHSATKSLGGHSDVLAGLVVTRDDALAKEIGFIQNATGGVLSPMDSWLLLRGMKTLGVRTEAAQESARRIARWLAARPEVKAVYHPGLSGFPGADVHARQAAGPGALLSLELREGWPAETFVRHLSLWTLAVSLGAVESLACVPARMTHATYDAAERARTGIADNLVRLAVGLEDPEDLITDIETALEKAKIAP
ncbi:MAG: PLP-dependent aspartate aminotransferase family protein [Planctomycetota bacterium]